MKVNVRNQRGVQWEIYVNPDGTWPDSKIQIALLADIRDTLVEIRDDQRRLLSIFQCTNTQAGFRALRSIARSERQRLAMAEKRRTKR